MSIGFPLVRPPERLIDPEGEGAYFLSDSNAWTLQTPAFEFYGDARRWRDLDHETVWMREGEDGNWHPDRWHRRYALLPRRRCPVVPYAYVTPGAERPTIAHVLDEHTREEPTKA